MGPAALRWTRITMRSLHIASLTVLMGAMWLEAEIPQLVLWLAGTAATGGMLLANPHYPNSATFSPRQAYLTSG